MYADCWPRSHERGGLLINWKIWKNPQPGDRLLIQAPPCRLLPQPGPGLSAGVGTSSLVAVVQDGSKWYLPFLSWQGG